MIKPIIEQFKTGRAAVFGPARLSYPHLFEVDDLTGKYSCTLILPEKDKETIEALNRAIDEVADLGVTLKWKGQRPSNILRPLERMLESPAGMDDCWALKMSTKDRPALTDRDKQTITDPEELYGGCWVIASVGFAAYEFGGKKGVTCYLRGLRKVRDGERFGSDARSALNGVNIDDLIDDEDL